MYKLKHWLFGWDYIKIRYPISGSGISRVRKLSGGTLGFRMYDGVCLSGEIKYASQVFWLTCNPSKYGF